MHTLESISLTPDPMQCKYQETYMAFNSLKTKFSVAGLVDHSSNAITKQTHVHARPTKLGLSVGSYNIKS